MSFTTVEKKSALGIEQKRALIEPAHPQLSIRRQCLVLGFARSTLYDRPWGESAEHLHRMRVLDEQYTATPFYGIRRMTAWLRQRGYAVNPKRVGRLLRQMGLEAIYPKPRLSQPAAGQTLYPYLLRGITDRPGQSGLARGYHLYPTPVWVCVPGGGDGLVQPVCAGLGAFDHAGDGILCGALQHALGRSSKPEIFNTDQGVQFTSPEFLEPLTAGGIRISMDGRGRAYDNIFVERLWRSVKYEEVYLRDYRTLWDARHGLVR